MNYNPEVDLGDYVTKGLVRRRGILTEICWYMFNSILFNSYCLPINRLKSTILRLFGAKIGKKVVIKPGVNIKYPWLLEIGDYVWIGEGVWIDNLTNVTIGNNVCISQGAMLLTGNHNYKKRTFDLILGEIILEDGVWIGAKSTIGPGVVCGTHSILTMGAIAIHNMDAYSVYQGNPAQKTRDRKIDG
jgi:putative colanic acid biosynthesis acetyltransferase WcaF